eukprot:4159616-Prymnesium_polylepis.2
MAVAVVGGGEGCAGNCTCRGRISPRVEHRTQPHETEKRRRPGTRASGRRTATTGAPRCVRATPPVAARRAPSGTTRRSRCRSTWPCQRATASR